MALFLCPICYKCKEVSNFRTFYKEGKKINVNLISGKKIVCPECNIAMNFVPKVGVFGVSYSPFSGLSPLEKQRLLRKRSEADNKKQQYVKQEEEKVHFNA